MSRQWISFVTPSVLGLLCLRAEMAHAQKKATIRIRLWPLLLSTLPSMLPRLAVEFGPGSPTSSGFSVRRSRIHPEQLSLLFEAISPSGLTQPGYANLHSILSDTYL